MRYQLEMDISAPREKIIALFDELDHYKEWQPDLISYTLLSGALDEVGRKTKLVQKMGKRDFEMIETVTVHDPPEDFAATYEAEGVWNLVENRFDVVDENTTKWTLTSDFRCKGFLRLMTIFMPGMFKKQTLAHMNHFKNFVERTADSND